MRHIMENDMASARREAGGVGGAPLRSGAARIVYGGHGQIFLLFFPDIVKAHTHGQD